MHYLWKDHFPQDLGVGRHPWKKDRVAPFVADPPQQNSSTTQNPAMVAMVANVLIFPNGGVPRGGSVTNVTTPSSFPPSSRPCCSACPG